MKKRIGSILLSLCLCLGLLPAGAFAAEGAGSHAHCACGASSVCSHGHDSNTWTAWDGSDISYDSTSKVAYVYLSDNVTLSELTVESSHNLYLCLNGKTLNGSLKVTGGNLTLCDCSGDQTGKITSTGTGVTVDSSGYFNMYGGSISGCKGGGVAVNSGSFNMYGGTISNNTTSGNGNGGGVFVSGSTSTFKMHGGSISNNTTTSSNNGGGVYIGNQGTFNMDGGTISGNTTSGNGGGVYVGSGTAFWVSGNVNITGNTKDSAANNVYLVDGAAIAIAYGSSLNSTSKIGVTTATAPTSGSSVCIVDYDSTDYCDRFQSDITGYQVSYNNNNDSKHYLQIPGPYQYTDSNNVTAYSNTLLEAMQNAKDGTTITVLKDIEDESKIALGTRTYSEGETQIAGKTLTINLNGNTISCRNNNGLIKVCQGGTLTIQGGTYGGLLRVQNGGSLTIDDVTLSAPQGRTPVSAISGSLAVWSGTTIPWLEVYPEASVTLHGGTFPGKIYVYSDSSENDARGRLMSFLATGKAYGHTDITTESDSESIYKAHAEISNVSVVVKGQSSTGYTVTFNANGGTVTTTSAVTDANGKLISLPTPTWDGHTFKGWFNATDGGTKITTDTKFTEATTIYAQWYEYPHTGAVSTDSSSGVAAEGLNDAATAAGKNLVLTVKTEAPAEGDTEQSAIQTAAGGKATQFLDITLKAENGNNIYDTRKVLEIAVPFDTTGKKNISVYRYHGNDVDTFTEVHARSEANNRTDKTFFVGDGIIYIYTNQFSTYAIGYTESAPAPSTGGDGTPTYAISVAKTGNGAVKADRRYAESGDIVTVTAQAEEGYVLSGLTVSDRGGELTQLTALGNGSYTFPMPPRDITVTAVFAPEEQRRACPQDSTCPIAAYTDAEPTAWYHDGVHYCIEQGLMTGYGKGTFRPNADTTRGMVMVILWRLEGSPVVNAPLRFDDVEEGQWYAEAVRWAVSEGIATGIGGGRFGADQTVTREQLVTFLWRYAKYKGLDVSVGEETNILSYDDAFAVSDYAISAFQWAAGAGIVQGVGSNLMPQASCTRAQLATMLYRLLGD